MNGIVWDVVYVNRVGGDGYGGGYGSVVKDVVVNVNEGVERFENGCKKEKRVSGLCVCETGAFCLQGASTVLSLGGPYDTGQ